MPASGVAILGATAAQLQRAAATCHRTLGLSEVKKATYIPPARRFQHHGPCCHAERKIDEVRDWTGESYDGRVRGRPTAGEKSSPSLGRGLINAQPQPDRRELNESEVVRCKFVVARCNPTTVLDFVEEPFDQFAGAIEI